MKRLLLALLLVVSVQCPAPTLTFTFVSVEPGTNWTYWLAWTNSVSTNKIPSRSPIVVWQNAEAYFPTNGGSVVAFTISNSVPNALESAPTLIISPVLPMQAPPKPPGGTINATP